MKATCLWELDRINLKGRGEDYSFAPRNREIDLDITITDARKLLETLQEALNTFDAFQEGLEEINN